MLRRRRAVEGGDRSFEPGRPLCQQRRLTEIAEGHEQDATITMTTTHADVAWTGPCGVHNMGRRWL